MAIDLQKVLTTSNVASEGLIIDCKMIKIVQNRDSEPIVFEAAGALVVDFRAGITARVVAYEPNEVGFKQMNELMEIINLEPGDLVPASRYYTLTATDADGDEWTNPIVEVSLTRLPTHTVALVKCNWIRCVSRRGEGTDSARVLFIDEVDLPKNVPKLTAVTLGGRNFDSHERGGSVGALTGASFFWTPASTPRQLSEIYVASDVGKSLPLNFVAKLLESIRFVTASRIAPCVTQIVAGQSKVVEISVARPLESGLFEPPLRPDANIASDFYLLLDAYLIDAISTSQDDEFSPISSILHPLFGTGSLSLHALTLLLCVAIESLAQARFENLAPAPPELIAEVAEISAAISGLDISKPAKHRALSVVGGMRSSRAADKLFELTRHENILEAEIKTWKSLRNTTAHGSLHVDPSEYQLMLNKVYALNVLINKIVMIAIGYDGAFNDYSKRGWPMVARKPRDEGPKESDKALNSD